MASNNPAPSGINSNSTAGPSPSSTSGPSSAAIGQSHRIAPLPVLTKAEDWPIWSRRVRAKLKINNLWNEKADLPADTNTTYDLIEPAISNTLWHIISFSEDLIPSEIWTLLSNNFAGNSLPFRIEAIQSLMQFKFTRDFPMDASTFQHIEEKIIQSFGSDSIKVKDLAMMALLAKIPPDYVHVRSTISMIDKEFTKDQIFEQLKQEQAVSNAPTSFRTKTDSKRCPHKQISGKCWTCDPSIAPTCELCKAAGFERTTHYTDCRFCKEQRAGSKPNSMFKILHPI
jgi:hypothetical protein